MQTTDVKIKYINKLSDLRGNPCVVVFSEHPNVSGTSAVAWQVFNNISSEDWQTFNYTLSTSVQVTWNNGKSGIPIVEVKNSSFSFEETERGFSLVEHGSSATPQKFEVINKVKIPGGISVRAFKDGKPIVVKHTVAKDQKARFAFQPKLYWAVVSDIDLGDLVYLNDIPNYTEISLEGLQSLSVILTGNLQDGYSFTAAEKVPASDLEPIEPIDPEKPTEPSEENKDESVPETILMEGGEYQDLFPFVYLRTWSKISSNNLQQHFLQYDSKNAPSESLYNNLVEIKKASQPDVPFQMKTEAINFIEGTKFAGQFISSINDLKGSIKYFSLINSWLRTQTQINLPQLQEKIAKVLTLNLTQVKTYIDSQDYLQEKDIVWNNLFALTIVSNNQQHLLQEITNTLLMCNLIERMVANEQSLDTSQEIIDLAKATIILPKDIFPLPTASKNDSPSDPKTAEWIEPYAIGDLQIVRQRLLKYELGEIAHIENVLKGERKETTQRKLNRVNESVSNTSGELEQNESDINSTRADLLNETLRTLAQDKVTTSFNNFQTTYGPPTTATFNGSWSVENTPKSHNEQARKFAQDITTKTANRIARYVNQTRTLNTLNEAEETVIHAFDNTASTSNVIGIYRWVNKIYAAYVVNYGNRLMLEFMLTNPAESYIKSLFQLQGVSLSNPIYPGIDSYKNVTRENYADLFIKYEVKDCPSPPAKNKVILMGFKDGETINIKKMLIPEGYKAVSASVTCVLPNTQLKLIGSVGKEKFDASKPETLDIKKLNDEDSAIVACVICSEDQTLLPIPTNQTTTKYCVSIEITCELADAKFEEWQIKAYNAIVNGYQKQKADYYELSGVLQTQIGSHNPITNRKIENQEIKKGCTRQLLKQHLQLVVSSQEDGKDQEPSEFAVNQPKYSQFCEQAFEWEEMTYQFYPRLEETALNYYSSTDALFTSFLQSGSARVLVPVKSDQAMLVLYYLSSGMIWSGKNALTPTIEDEKYVSLVNELKVLSESKLDHKSVSKAWEITIPTSMIMLQDSSKLPLF
ncbi:MAG: hypothetical protein U7123_00225 [Potamolinea sp.]